jgi:hypothetical protein
MFNISPHHKAKFVFSLLFWIFLISVGWWARGFFESGWNEVFGRLPAGGQKAPAGSQIQYYGQLP